MSSPEKALQTQLTNIQTKTGKSLDELAALVRSSGLAKHGEIRDMLQRELGLGHGDANTLVHVVLKPAGGDDPLAEIYSGPKAALRPIHEALMAEIERFGEFEIAPKKGYVSLRRRKQFAMLGPATNARFEVGLNMKDAPAAARLEAQPPKGMCSHKVKLTTVTEANAELIAWIRLAYDGAA